MTYKQRESAREIRLWIGQVIVPLGAAGITVFAIPENREKAKKAWNTSKEKVKNVFRKGKRA